MKSRSTESNPASVDPLPAAPPDPDLLRPPESNDPARPGRLLIVSNRLPITVRSRSDGLEIQKASGGLATGLNGPHEESEGLWIGWPGDVTRLRRDQRDELTRELADRRIVPLYLTPKQVDLYYEEFSNGVLWPLFHYLLDRVPRDPRGWEAYQDVNERFAEAIAAQYRSGDRVWIHDYQLLLVPEMLRRRIPEARIGFFLHIPFPSSEIFKILPWRDRILEGLLGADLIGFHSFSYQRHFASSLREILGFESDVDLVVHDGRPVRMGVFPMGIDTEAFAPRSRAAAAAVRREAGGRRILLGIDRLDYTKGIPHRLLAFERLLEKEPDLRHKVRLIQVAVPTRTGVPEYQDYRSEVEGLVGRINGAYATVDSVPIHYMYRSVPHRKLVGLYQAADVMLVTALRDGMNLVAKEFIASRDDEDGVLVLSEFAGASSELGEAVPINPYDIDGTAHAMLRALEMPLPERRTRMKALRRRVTSGNVHAWVSSFLKALDDTARESGHLALTLAPRLDVASAAARFRNATELHILMDYDGTLVPLARSPELAAPDPELKELIRAVIARPSTWLSVVSGRLKRDLEEWLGDLDIDLWAEHGFWHRPFGSRDWRPLSDRRADVMDRVRPILTQFMEQTPGSLIEEKSASMAWHYRMSSADFGTSQARRLRAHLGEVLQNQPVEILPGSKVVEVRLQGVDKGRAAERILADHPDAAYVAFGDDATDEDLFAALPAGALTVKVGAVPTVAAHSVPGVGDVRAFLKALLAS